MIGEIFWTDLSVMQIEATRTAAIDQVVTVFCKARSVHASHRAPIGIGHEWTKSSEASREVNALPATSILGMRPGLDKANIARNTRREGAGTITVVGPRQADAFSIRCHILILHPALRLNLHRPWNQM